MSNVRPQQMSYATSHAFGQSSSVRFVVRASLSRLSSVHGSAFGPAERQRRQLRSRQSMRSSVLLRAELLPLGRLQQAGTAALVSYGTRGQRVGARNNSSTARVRKAAAWKRALVRRVSAAQECAA
jgi:hypothetical protein